VFNIPLARPVQDLLGRSGDRLELVVHFSVSRGYEVLDWNREAADTFGLDPAGPGGVPLGWARIPKQLAEYLAQALQAFS
jgi:hypothetical protein